jgi:hypothetical protein
VISLLIACDGRRGSPGAWVAVQHKPSPIKGARIFLPDFALCGPQGVGLGQPLPQARIESHHQVIRGVIVDAPQAGQD